MTKHAVLSLDIEDWRHLDYFDAVQCDPEYSMLDGIDVYLEFLDKHALPSSFFCIGELAAPLGDKLRDIHDLGHDIGSHTFTHKRPMTTSVDEFKQELLQSKDAIEQEISAESPGFRAPCFSLDRERLDVVRDCGLRYDASRIDFSSHPLYGTLDLKGFEELKDGVYRSGDFFEFEATTTSFMGKKLPISGGGYLRIFPWGMMSRLVAKRIQEVDFYTLYIHPFELSRRKPPSLKDLSVSWKTKARFRAGLGGVEKKLTRLVELLKQNGFTFTTYSQLREDLMTTPQESS